MFRIFAILAAFLVVLIAVRMIGVDTPETDALQKKGGLTSTQRSQNTTLFFMLCVRNYLTTYRRQRQVPGYIGRLVLTTSPFSCFSSQCNRFLIPVGSSMNLMATVSIRVRITIPLPTTTPS